MDLGGAPATFGILGLTVLVSFLALRTSPSMLQRNLLRPYWLVRKRNYDTLVTCGFIHGDFGHLFFNMLTLYFFGAGLEHRIGTTRFIALYFLGLVISSVGTVIKRRKDPNYASLGASGAILAVLFAFIVYYPTSNIYVYFALPVPAVLYAVGYLAYTLWASKNGRDHINHDAHLDGALTGLIFVGVTDFAAWKHAFDLVLS